MKGIIFFLVIFHCFYEIFVQSVDYWIYRQANNNFALNLFRQVGDKNQDNVFISPLGVQALLSLLLQGANNQTEKELRKSLLYETLTNDEINKHFQSLNIYLNSHHINITLNFVNRIYMQQGLLIRNYFKNISNKYYNGSFHEGDFKNHPKDVVEEINLWVQDQTNKRITSLLNDLSPETLIILLSAIYFKGSWAHPFKEKVTKVEKFIISQDEKIEILMMSQNGTLRYAEDYDHLKCQIVELPYSGERFSMFVMLPFHLDGLKDLEAKLNYADLHSLIVDMETTHLMPIKLPKFKIAKAYNLIPVLKSIGIQKLFDSADLMGIFQHSLQHIKVSDVIQKTFIEINEEGSESASVTGIKLQPRSFKLPPKQNSFIANRPFIFFIQENTNGSILFIGRFSKGF